MALEPQKTFSWESSVPFALVSGRWGHNLLRIHHYKHRACDPKGSNWCRAEFPASCPTGCWGGVPAQWLCHKHKIFLLDECLVNAKHRAPHRPWRPLKEQAYTGWYVYHVCSTSRVLSLRRLTTRLPLLSSVAYNTHSPFSSPVKSMSVQGAKA